MMFTRIFMLVLLCGGILSLHCPHKSPMKDFNVYKYMSTYNEVYYYGNDNFTDYHRCPRESFYYRNGHFSLNGTVLDFKSNREFHWRAGGNMATPGIFNVTQEMYGDRYHFDLVVLGTDYKDWIVIWSCPFISGIEAGWIMTRKQYLVNETLPEKEMKEITKVLLASNIPWTRFSRTQNYDCHYS